MSDYCKYHPLDPSCVSFTRDYQPRSRKKTQTKPRDHPSITERPPPLPRTDVPPPRRDITDVQQRPPPPRRDITDIEDEPTLYYGTQRPPTHRRNITDIRKRKELIQQGRIPAVELRSFTKKYNQRLEAGKKRALELLKVGQEEVIEPRDQHKYGHMTQAAYEYAYEGKKAANKQLAKGGEYIEELKGFKIRPEFSDYDYLALHNPETGERVMAGRGSDTEFFKADANIKQALRGQPLTKRLQKGVNDWVVNAKWLMKKHLDTSTYKNQEADLLRWAEADGVPIKSIKHTGHSKAGATGEYLARKYGGEAHLFNPATHPTSELIPNEEVHPDTKINVYREEFDFVSGARTYKKTPKFMEVHTYTTPPGTEDDLMGRHDHVLAIPEPSRIEDGNILVKRNTKFRNRVAFAGTGAKGVAEKGIAGVKGAVMALPAMAFQPEYKNPVERKYRRAELGVDLIKGGLEYESVGALGMGSAAKGIGRYTQALAPGAAIGAYTDLLMLDQQDNKVLHEGLAKVRHKIFGADPEEPEFVYTPKWIKKIQTPERRRQEAAREEEYRVYREEFLWDIEPGDPDYLTFDEYLERYGDADGFRHAQAVEALGFDPLGDSEQAERMREVEASFTPAGEGALAYSTEQAEQLARAARPRGRPRRNITEEPERELERFEMGGKTYVEVP